MNSSLFNRLPIQLQSRLKGYALSLGPTVGMTGDKLFWADGEVPSILKVSESRHEELNRQFEVICWLDSKLLVPRPLYFGVENGLAALWMTRMDGEDASEWCKKEKPEKVAAACAGAMLMVHRIPDDDCPLDSRLDLRIKEAEKRAEAGLVDLNDVDEQRRGMSAEVMIKQLHERRPASEDLVFTHGDFCLPNLMFAGGKPSGYVDLGRAGVADRYQDLALLTRSLQDNLGQDMSEMVARVYGLKELDYKKIEYYRLLDEFF